MKRITSLLLIAALCVGVIYLTACDKNKNTADPAKTAQESIASDLEPFSVGSDGKATGYFKNDTDANGNITRHYIYNALGEIVGSVGYEYDENGNVIKEIVYSAKGEITGQTLYEKTKDDRTTKRTDLDSDGQTVAVTTTEYTDFGAEKAVYKYDGSDTLLTYTIYEYDGETVSKVTVYNGNGTVENYTTFDKDGKAHKFDADDNPIS